MSSIVFVPLVPDKLRKIPALCDKLASGWTDKQEFAVYSMLMARIRGERLTQAELADNMGVGQSTVNAQLSAAGFNEYCAGILHIRRELALLAEEETV